MERHSAFSSPPGPRIRDNGAVGRQSAGKRAGARKGARPRRGLRRDVFGLALAVTVAVVAWGYLVYAAIDFGSQARAGDGRAWAFLALAAVGAAACLFVALMLASRILQRLSSPPAPAQPVDAPAPRHAGEHR